MEKEIRVKVGTIPELIRKPVETYRYGNDVEVIALSGQVLNCGGVPDVGIPLRVDAVNVILTLEGEARLDVDACAYTLRRCSAMSMIGVKVLRNFLFSDDYRGYHLMVSKEFYDDISKEGKHLTPEVAMRKTCFPYDDFSSGECRLLEKCIDGIIEIMGRTDHVWHRQMVEIEVRRFFMEMGNMIVGKCGDDNFSSLSRLDILFFKFIRLVEDNGGRRRSVAFYADKLCITPDYLAQSIKDFSKKPVSYWINESIVVGAKKLLLDCETPIIVVAETLNFADQSAFGRFFKKHTGMSPAEYRRRNSPCRY